jgi:hypothetical protein
VRRSVVSRSRTVAFSWACALVVGCGHTTEDSAGHASGGNGGAAGHAAGSGGTPNDASAAGAAGTGGSSGKPITPFDAREPTFPDVVTTDAWCARDAGVGQLTACCNDTPCEGLCYDVDASVECQCYGVVDGCQKGTVCCATSLACVLGCNQR